MSEINNIHARLKRAFEKRGVDFSSDGQVNDTNPIMYQRAFNILKRKGADFSTPSGHPSFDSIRGVNGRHFPHQKVPNAFVANPNWNGYGKVEFGGGGSSAPGLKFTANTPGSTIGTANMADPDTPMTANLETSIDDGVTWTPYNIGDVITLANAGDSVLFRGNNPSGFNDLENDKIMSFAGTGSLAASGDVMYLFDHNASTNTIPHYGCYGLFVDQEGDGWLTSCPDISAKNVEEMGCGMMFAMAPNLVKAPKFTVETVGLSALEGFMMACPNLTDASDLHLNAMALADRCYATMFSDCASLVNVPDLPATTLADECYESMFSHTSLTNAPELPAMNMAESCYSSMFNGCDSLVNAPALPATTLAESCYHSMFVRCDSLINAPALPATTLAESCYDSMFRECAALVNAPALPATTLAESCYESMFEECSALVNAPALPATTLAESCYESMFSRCTSLIDAPAISATTLAEHCCESMFDECTSLVNVPALPATTAEANCYQAMFRGCTAIVNAPEIFLTNIDSAYQCLLEMFRNCSSLNYVKIHYSGALPTSTYSTTSWLLGVSGSGDAYFNGTVTDGGTGDSIPAGWTVHAF